MNFTSVDPPQVIRFVRSQYPDVVTHAPRKSIFDLAIERGILPSMRIRWCCADLKETAGAGKVTLIGIRKEESARRAKRHEVEVSDKKFSGSLEEFWEWQAEQIEKKEASLIKKMQKEGKKVNEDEFSLQKENEVRCINGKDSILISPIFEWSEQDVWYFLNEVVKVPHCVLYDQGYKRIGCILCPMSQYRQKVREMKDFPHVKRGWIKAIKEIRRSVADIQETTPPTSSASGTPKQHGRGYGSTLSDWQWKYHDGKRLSPPPEWMEKVLQLRDGKCAEFHRGTIQQFENIKPIRNAVLQEPVHEGDSTTDRICHRQNTIGTGNATSASGVGFLDSPSAGGVVEGQTIEMTEDEIAENIFDWWVSGKSYSRWYADKFLQQKIDFDFDEDAEK